ncbi:hypothetical protein BDV32DRAFT_144020 [Aspergillus pseudonomiae]|uniref:Uncharacterized protein n=1 Tax=Aspergillus pseudonomiae TaxID=1506151 RepID=A0A5N6IJE2_9EURO|nr:uncharacterized protein BDV37DRAFT_282748 [Aspergillus pseudonomiae]KAB8266297.1 hypothetical protein BDV32DRAFT_144020 [Aspergillus pseudonomiae]KAE8404452.1 hypothetical protein BDV37DRAFT_282748 [Aspergillus pseudonomiae]
MASRHIPTGTFLKDETKHVTVFLDASDEGYSIDQEFSVSTPVGLVYAERVRLKGSIKLSGKKLGLFCTELEIAPDTTIDVSGTQGEPGIGEGTNGGNGGNAGELCMVVQRATVSSLKTLNIKAYGGDGGRGGDATASSGTGGKGGNGGNGGTVHIFYGSDLKLAVLKVESLKTAPWRFQLPTLLEASFRGNLTADELSLLEGYERLAATLANLLEPLDRLAAISGGAEDVKASIQNLLESQDAPTMALPPVLTTLESQVERLGNLASNPTQTEVDSIVTGIADAVGTIEISRESELRELVKELALRLRSEVKEGEYEVKCQVKKSAGVGGQGGRSAVPLSAPGSFGEQGQVGSAQATDLTFNGDRSELEIGHAFASPDQSQMLLQEANRAFFSNTPEEQKRASMLYERLIQRLSFLKVIDFAGESNLAKAYRQQTEEWELTLFPEAELRSILKEAASHLNRLMLGRDMWGHHANWIPRMSVQFYHEELDRQLPLLRDQESILADYESARKEAYDSQRLIRNGIESMDKKLSAASDQIARLTVTNGPLASSIDTINAVTPRMKTSKSDICEKLKNVTPKPQGPPIKEMKMILEALTTLAAAKADVGSIAKIMKLGLRECQAFDDVENVDGKSVSKELLVKQIATCGDNLASLKDAYKMNADRSMTLESSESLILTTKANIEKLVKDYSNLFPDEWRAELSSDLNAYVALVQARNEALVEYNSTLQLLLQAAAEKKHSTEQLGKLRQEGLEFNRRLPLFVHWQRKCCNSLRFSIMRNLNYQSRAIRYWGLQQNTVMADSMPLQTYSFLSARREQLLQSFNQCLENYAGGIRSTWPQSPAQGLMRKLTPSELHDLKSTGSAYIHLHPSTDDETFGDQIDIRLQQVRLWLPGAEKSPESMGRKLLTVYLTHLGESIIQDSNHLNFAFFHDTVKVMFKYDAAKVLTRGDIHSDHVFNQQLLEGTHDRRQFTGQGSIAAIGPFAWWKVDVPRGGVNQDLNLDGVTEAYLEFHGTSRPPR